MSTNGADQPKPPSTSKPVVKVIARSVVATVNKTLDLATQSGKYILMLKLVLREL